MLFVNRETATELGMTHEGRFYGVPVWMKNIHDEAPDFCAKFQPLRHWMDFCDFAFYLASYAIPADRYLVSPLTVIGPIK